METSLHPRETPIRHNLATPLDDTAARLGTRLAEVARVVLCICICVYICIYIYIYTYYIYIHMYTDLSEVARVVLVEVDAVVVLAAGITF